MVSHGLGCIRCVMAVTATYRLIMQTLRLCNVFLSCLSAGPYRVHSALLVGDGARCNLDMFRKRLRFSSPQLDYVF
jgi:hypothetical protein